MFKWNDILKYEFVTLSALSMLFLINLNSKIKAQEMVCSSVSMANIKTEERSLLYSYYLIFEILSNFSDFIRDKDSVL